MSEVLEGVGVVCGWFLENLEKYATMELALVAA